MNRILLTIAIILLANRSVASELDCQAHGFTAHYIVTQQVKGQVINQQRISVLVDKAAVGYQYHDFDLVDIWQKNLANKLQLIRLYPHYQQGIEYQSNELIDTYQWSDKRYLLPEVISQMLLKNTVKSCSPVLEQQVSVANVHYQISWLAGNKIPKKLVTHAGNSEQYIVWQLTELTINQTQINEQFTKWYNVPVTDFADIGDNEANPFLAKMIHQGFKVNNKLMHAH